MSPTAPSAPSSTPSYSPCATRMVFLLPNASFFAASCWSVLVVNGAEGFFRRSRRRRSVTWNASRDFTAFTMSIASRSDVQLRLLAVHLVQARRELLSVLLEQRLDGPVLHRLERADLALALDDQPSATVCTRPAESPLRTVFQSSGLAL